VGHTSRTGPDSPRVRPERKRREPNFRCGYVTARHIGWLPHIRFQIERLVVHTRSARFERFQFLHKRDIRVDPRVSLVLVFCHLQVPWRTKD